MSRRQPIMCMACGKERAAARRGPELKAYCKSCFCESLEEDVHRTIVREKLVLPGDKIALAVSGGKDSTALAHVMMNLDRRHHYGAEFVLLSIDEGIVGYRDESLETVKRNKVQYGLPLLIVSFKDLYGYTLDEIAVKTAEKNTCTFCGVFRRHSFDKGAIELGCNKVATGHNADDAAETILMNCKPINIIYDL